MQVIISKNVYFCSLLFQYLLSLPHITLPSLRPPYTVSAAAVASTPARAAAGGSPALYLLPDHRPDDGRGRGRGAHRASRHGRALARPPLLHPLLGWPRPRGHARRRRAGGHVRPHAAGGAAAAAAVPRHAGGPAAHQVSPDRRAAGAGACIHTIPMFRMKNTKIFTYWRTECER